MGAFSKVLRCEVSQSPGADGINKTQASGQLLAEAAIASYSQNGTAQGFLEANQLLIFTWM